LALGYAFPNGFTRFDEYVKKGDYIWVFSDETLLIGDPEPSLMGAGG